MAIPMVMVVMVMMKRDALKIAGRFLGSLMNKNPVERQSSFHLELVTVASDDDIFYEDDKYRVFLLVPP